MDNGTNISESGSQRATTGLTRSRAGKPPLDADNTLTDSAYIISSSKSSSISASRETRAAQGEGITNSGTILSTGSMQPPGHTVTNSPPSRNVLPSLELRENSSNIFLPVAAPSPEEMMKMNGSPHLQEDSRSQRTVISPHTNERRANTPHAEQVDHIASIQPSAKLPIPSSPPFSSSEKNATKTHTDPGSRTASSFVQPSIKPSIPYPPPFSYIERNATRPHAEPVDRTDSVQPPVNPSTPPSPLDRPSASISPSSSPLAPALAKMASNRVHPPRDMLSYEYQARSREFLSESPHPPLVDRGNVRPDEQALKDPSAASRRPHAPSEHTPTTTKPPWQDHEDPTTTDLHSRKNKVPSATSDMLPVPPEHTLVTTVSPILQDPKGASTPFRPPVLCCIIC